MENREEIRKAIKFLTFHCLPANESTNLYKAVMLAISALEKQEQTNTQSVNSTHRSCPNALESLNILEQAKDDKGCVPMSLVRQAFRNILEQDRWIPVTERLPKCEQEVLICTKKKTYIHEKSGFEWCVNPIVTPAMYEDGTMLEVDSKWHWEDCDWAGWDEEEDCGIIPEGWWENSQFNPDGEYNHEIDVEVVAWRPLPEPYKAEEFEEDRDER